MKNCVCGVIRGGLPVGRVRIESLREVVHNIVRKVCQWLICIVLMLRDGYDLVRNNIFLKMFKEIPLDRKFLKDLNSTEGLNDEELASLELFQDYPPALLDFAAACCVIFMMIGIPGNFITVWSLARYKKVRNATAIFIMNLSCSDFLFCCINLPLAASTFWSRRWYHGVFVCQFFPFARFLFAGVSIFTILAITVNRYVMISYLRIYNKLYTSLNMGIIIAATWIISLACLTPVWLEVWGRYGMDPKLSFCAVLEDHDGNTPMRALFISAFIVPFFTIAICYARIFYIVRKTTAKSMGPIHRKHQVANDDTSLATSTGDKSPNSVAPNNTKNLNQHPRVQSLKPANVHVEFTSDLDNSDSNIPRTESASSNTSNFSIARAINLRKSQILKFAAPTSKDKRLLTMITAIMIAFFVCHLPITIIKAFSELTSPTPLAIICSYLLRYLTTCVNPIIYVVMSHEYRKAYKKAVVMPSCRIKCCIPS